MRRGGFCRICCTSLEHINTWALVSDNAAEIRGKYWGTEVSPVHTSALFHAETGEIVSFLQEFWEDLLCQDVCAAVSGGMSDSARWTPCLSGSDHWPDLHMSEGLVTY